jgi:hypothetical protein
VGTQVCDWPGLHFSLFQSLHIGLIFMTERDPTLCSELMCCWLLLLQPGKSHIMTGYGVPVYSKDASLTVGSRGPMLLQDVEFLDELAHFDRERIPERVVHA